MPTTPRKSAPKPKAKAKAKPASKPDVAQELAEAKEKRGRTYDSTPPQRVGRPLPPDPPPPVDEEEKRAWKESRNQHPGPTAVPKNRPEPEEVEPPRERTPEEIAAKERRGSITRS